MSDSSSRVLKEAKILGLCELLRSFNLAWNIRAVIHTDRVLSVDEMVSMLEKLDAERRTWNWVVEAVETRVSKIRVNMDKGQNS